MSRNISLAPNVRPILAAIRSFPASAKREHNSTRAPAAPFVTISRQPGAGGWTLARHLVDAMNADTTDETRWTCWDRELVEKVAADFNLSTQLIDSIERSPHSWLNDILNSLSFEQTPDEVQVYHRVAATIRALAQAGRVVIVGRGGVFITRDMPGAIHVRLVAPFEQRVQFMQREYGLTPDRAADRIKELERNRHAFYRRYWPDERMAPDTFSMVLNTAAIDPPTMVQLLVTLIRRGVPAAV